MTSPAKSPVVANNAKKKENRVEKAYQKRLQANRDKATQKQTPIVKSERAIKAKKERNEKRERDAQKYFRDVWGLPLPEVIYANMAKKRGQPYVNKFIANVHAAELARSKGLGRKPIPPVLFPM